MADDRLFHKKLGHSEKVHLLTDMEDIAWQTYIMAADDFGVMWFSAFELQRARARLAKRPTRAVQRMLEHIRDVGLIRTFGHQGQTFCYQHDWQDFQKIRYAMKTNQPQIPDALLMDCTRNTQWLQTLWPGGGGRGKQLANWKAPDDGWAFQPGSGNRSGNGFANGSRTVPALRANADADADADASLGESVERTTAVQLRPRAMQGSGVMAGSLPRDHLRHAWCGERICVPDFLHARFVRAIGGEDADERLRACYAEAMADIPPEDPIEPDPLKFWPPLVTSRWPAPQAAKTTTALTRASLGFLRGLRT